MCEICRRRPSPQRPLSDLCCHEIANGIHRLNALDKPFAILVLCLRCNQYEVTNKAKWPEARQLAVLKRSRPGDFDLRAYNELINPRAPDRITLQEVKDAADLSVRRRPAKPDHKSAV